MILFRVFSLFKAKLIGAPQLFVEFRAKKNREKEKRRGEKKAEKKKFFSKTREENSLLGFVLTDVQSGSSDAQ